MRKLRRMRQNIKDVHWRKETSGWQCQTVRQMQSLKELPKMPNLTLDANKIVYVLLSVIVFLGGFILKDFLSNNKSISRKQDEIAAQLVKINVQLVEIKKDILSRSDVVEIVNDELLKTGLIKYGKWK